MNIAVVGVGRMGALHAQLLRQLPGVDSLLIVDRDQDRAASVADKVQGELVSDPIEAIERADAAVIASPPDTHAMFVKAAVDRSRPVLCEKPLAVDLREAVELATYVESSDVPVQIGFQRRFDPAIATARRLVMDGSLGLIHLIRLDSTEPGLPRSDRTNLFRNSAIHDFDLARWLSGSEVASVYVEGSDRDRGTFDRSRDPDSIIVSMRLEDGSLCSVTTSRLSPHGYDVRAELVGSRDHVVAGWTERMPIRSLEPLAGPLARDTWQTWQARFEEAYRRELEAFLTVSDMGNVGATVRDGVEAQRVAEAAQKSLRDGRVVMIER